jgi:(4-(4-[2-(gamma-L-glutamylamino)ethyl]phenoxymethyl)furan-2-yl)methanamine synthase
VNWLALDIGAANIKAADGQGYAAIVPFALWQRPQHLADTLRAVITAAPACDHLAATMTAELADCFATKAEGVEFILQSLSTASDGRHTRIYLHDGRLVSTQVALREPLLAAATNWHALARFAAKHAATATALAIDIGSTTSDIIPLARGAVVARGRTDTERLANGELVYSGVERTPVCALAGYLPYHGELCPLAAEVFATTWDIYLILDDLAEEPNSNSTADGRPATRSHARDRLARTICADRESFSLDDAIALAEAASRHQLARLAVALSRVVGRMPTPPETIVISGRGEFLARRLIERMRIAARIVSLSQELGAQLSRCAPAHALAVIAREGSAA